MKIFLPLLILSFLLSQQGYSQTASGYVPDFSMSRQQFEDQVLKPKSEISVLDFWASWCGPSIESVPHIKEMQRKYSAKGVRFISLSWDNSEEYWLLALARLKMPWQHLLVSEAFKPFINQHFPHKGIPAAFVVRTDGKVKRVAGVGMLESTIIKALKASQK